MKLSISVPLTAVTTPAHPAADTWRIGKWFGATSPTPTTPKVNIGPTSSCRQALMEAIRQERLHIDNLKHADLPLWLVNPHVAVAVNKNPWVTAHRRVIRNPVEALAGFPSQDNFAALAVAYKSSGGIFRAEDLVRLATLGNGQGRAELIDQITSGSVLSFQWRQSYWVPIFQFESGSAVQKNCAREVIRELADTFNDWEKVVWFIQPNAWLGGGQPLVLMEHQLPEVVDAARADKFVAVG